MTSLTRRSSTRVRIKAFLLASAAVLFPAALLTQADVAAAQPSGPPDITVYHSSNPETGADPRSATVPPGCVEGTGGGGTGGWLVVVADVNGGNNPIFYTNVLEGGTNVLSARNGSHTLPTIKDLYSSLPGVTLTQNNTTITSELLAGVDLLMFHQNAFDQALGFINPDELTAIGNFLLSGGNVLSVMETDSHRANFNTYLEGIGSSIRVTADGRPPGTADVILGAPFTAGMGTDFVTLAQNVLTGGTPIANRLSDGLPIAAAEQLGGSGPVAECVLSGGANEEFDLWIDGGSTASILGETVCKMDQVDSPGGSGQEICGAELTFELEGPGRFVQFTPAFDMDTLVLGVPCPASGACILPTNPPTKLLQMNFRRGAILPDAARRRLGRLIVDSTGLDPEINFTEITVFGNAAGAKLQLRPISSFEARETIADSRLIEVPEPAQLVQLLSGLLGLAGLSQLRRRH